MAQRIIAIMADCLVCNKALQDDESHLSCCECDYSYHVGTCSGVTLSAYRKKSETALKSWKCATCKAGKTRSGQNATNDDEVPELNLSSEITEIHRKLAVLLEMKVKLDALEEIKETVTSVEQAIQEMSTKYDEVIIEMKQQNTDIANLRKRVEKLEVEVKDQEIDKLRQELNDLDQYGRRLNLEVHGLPHHVNENLLEKLNCLADDLELPHLSGHDIEAVHRIPLKSRADAVDDEKDKPSTEKSEKVPPVLVRFTSRATRDAWLGKKAQLKESDSKIFLNENLTAQNKKLFWHMKTRAAEKEYKFAWLKNGKFFVRRGPRARVIRIITMEDLDMIR